MSENKNQTNEKRKLNEAVIKEEKDGTNCTYNEKIHKCYKSHRDTNCTDWLLIDQVMRECIVIE